MPNAQCPMPNAPSRRCFPVSLLILGIIWLLGALCDRLWFALDHSIPAWDQADYLTGTLNYWQALQNPQWFNDEWWRSFWLLSTKIPPLTYIVTAVVQNIFGTGLDQATLVMLLFSAILLASVYGLGKVLFSKSVGLWAAALCQILPGLYRLRLDFLLDYPLAAVVTLTFFCLTVWQVRVKSQESRVKSQESKISHNPHSPLPTPLLDWFWAAVFGLSLGLALLVKQTALFFLLTPIVWVGFGTLRQRRWGRLAQLIGGLWLSVLVFAPWYRTNWLVIITSGKRATIDSAIAEGDAPLNTLQAWTYYWHQLPSQVSLPLLIVPIFALLLYWGLSKSKTPNSPLPTPHALTWLAVFWVGAYLLSSLNINKDDRYVLPYLPVLSVFLAYGLTRMRNLWGQRTRLFTVGLAVILMLLNLFPVGGFVGNWTTQILSPNMQHYPYMGQKLPHQQVIAQIIQTQPYLRSTLGVLPSTARINQHNFNYYGALQNFQVYGRQVGTREKQVNQDVRSLSWFLTKTGNQGSVPDAQASIVKAVEISPDFQLNKTWNLPDGNMLKLYHQRVPPVEVKPVSEQKTQAKITLSQVTVPEKVPPGVPIPVTYEWSGDSKELQSGLVLLTWQPISSNNPTSNIQHPKWIHDHSIGMGALHADSNQYFSVIERMSMLPPADTAPGNYTLEATYLNRVSRESYPIAVPPVTLQIDPQAATTPAPELDLVTQLRMLAADLPKGTKALDRVFAEIGRINQYDPIQDYLVQAQLTLEYRLQHVAQNPEWAYALALANVLQQRVQGAIASLEKVTQLDSQNPYAWAYLAFVQLYNWQPAAAEKSLQPSLAKNPNLPELKALSGVAALMQGNVVKAWQNLRELNIQN